MAYTRIPLDLKPSSVASAREATRRWVELVGRPLAEYAAAIVVAELVTNAILHARGPVALHLWSRHDGIKIGVSDGSAEPPVVPDVDLAAPSGRGLRLVEAFSSNWGYDVQDAGKTTWAEITPPRTLPTANPRSPKGRELVCRAPGSRVRQGQRPSADHHGRLAHAGMGPVVLRSGRRVDDRTPT